MLRYKIKNNYKELWDKLSFAQIKHTPERRQDWQTYAEQAIEALKIGNTGLVADTATGKTIMAHLVIFATNARVLFLVPQRYLAKQHELLWHELTENSNHTKVLTGLNKKRDWQEDVKIYFATPQVFWQDYNHGKTRLENFDLIIIDEFHRSSGRYEYVLIAQLTLNRNIRILGLTASPGSDIKKIQQIAKNLNLSQWVRAIIKTPIKFEDLVIAEPDEIIKEVSWIFLQMLMKTALELKSTGLHYPINPLRRLSITDLSKIDKEIETIRGYPEYYQAISASAKYKKLSRAYRLIITEHYSAFLEYVQAMSLTNTSSSWSIIENDDFKQTIQLAKENIDSHPKILKLLRVANQHLGAGRNAIIFVSEKKNTSYIKEVLEKGGARVAVVFGGLHKNLKEQEKNLALIAQKEIDFLLATSVLEEGVNVPEINAVFHYSLPMNAVSRLQRSGRTGRSQFGNVVYFSMNHELDIINFFRVKIQEKQMKETINGFVALQKKDFSLLPPKPLTKSKKKH